MNLKNRYLMIIMLAFIKSVILNIPVEILEFHTILNMTFNKFQELSALIYNGIWTTYNKINKMVDGKDQAQIFAMFPVYVCCFLIIFLFSNNSAEKTNQIKQTYEKFNACIGNFIFNATGRET